MKQQLLLFQLPDNVRVFPNQFRELIAKLDLKRPEFFHRMRDGKMNPGLPALCFVGGRTWVGILAAPDSQSLLYDIAGPATIALSRHLQTSVPMQIKALSFGVSHSFSPIEYRLREVALKRRYQTTRDTPVDELIRARVVSGLTRIANTYGLDLPSENALDIHVNVLKERGLRLTVPNKVTNEYLHLVDADISMCAQLKGMWLVGNLTSRGYGRLISRVAGIEFNNDMEVEHDRLRGKPRPSGRGQERGRRSRPVWCV